MSMVGMYDGQDGRESVANELDVLTVCRSACHLGAIDLWKVVRLIICGGSEPFIRLIRNCVFGDGRSESFHDDAFDV